MSIDTQSFFGGDIKRPGHEIVLILYKNEFDGPSVVLSWLGSGKCNLLVSRFTLGGRGMPKILNLAIGARGIAREVYISNCVPWAGAQHLGCS